MAKIERIYQVDRIKIENGGAFKVVDEDYGYSVRPGTAARRRATLVEWCAQFLGFLSFFAMVGIVVAASGLHGSSVGFAELGVIGVGLTSTFGFFFIGTRGTATELQVDTKRHEYRVAIRNWRGIDRVQTVYALGNVESAFVRKKGFPAKVGQFLVRTPKYPQGVVLMSGDFDGLHHLHEVLSRPVADRQEYLGRTVSRPITVSLASLNGGPGSAKADQLAKLTEMARAKVKPKVKA